MITKFLVPALILLLAVGCMDQKMTIHQANDPLIRYSGRIDYNNTGGIRLIGSAASATMKFKGDSCRVLLKNNTPDGLYNFFAVELDGQYIGRYKLEGDSMVSHSVEVPKGQESHLLTIYKATEAANGTFDFCGLICNELLPPPEKPVRKIEFIGNSITCGMGVDAEEIPCGSGQWYDQHNAYLAYGPRVARKLNLQFMMSSVSGIGIYRNWNVDGPVMPDVYENRYLNTDSTKRWDFSQFTPDIVSIALGTNDFSDGDGVHERLPFDSERFTAEYIAFVEKIYSHYPSTQVALLTSPMLSGEKAGLLLDCLNNVKAHFDQNQSLKPIAIYQFEGVVPHGCDFHPDKKDQEQMAEAVAPFFQQLLDGIK